MKKGIRAEENTYVCGTKLAEQIFIMGGMTAILFSCNETIKRFIRLRKIQGILLIL